MFGVVASSVITAIGSLILAFYSGWKLALLVLAFIPFILIGSMLEMRLYFGSGDREDAINSEEAGKVFSISK